MDTKKGFEIVTDFETIATELEADKERSEQLRDRIKELDRASRNMAKILNKVHSTPQKDQQAIVRATTPHLAEIRQILRLLIAEVPKNEYYKWNDLWTMTLQRLAGTIAFAFYILTGQLASKEAITSILDIPKESKGAGYDTFHLATEEYLHAIVTLINELSRLAINSVTMGDFHVPLAASAFVKDVHAGFQLLNLKNDGLRKRFDSIKYDVKKIEEIVYDISLRGLVKPAMLTDAKAAYHVTQNEAITQLSTNKQ